MSLFLSLACWARKSRAHLSSIWNATKARAMASPSFSSGNRATLARASDDRPVISLTHDPASLEQGEALRTVRRAVVRRRPPNRDRTRQLARVPRRRERDRGRRVPTQGGPARDCDRPLLVPASL